VTPQEGSAGGSVGSGVGSGVGSSVGSGVGSGVGSEVGSGVGVTSSLGLGSTEAGGQGTAATSDPDGDGISNDGITPFSSGVGNGMQLGDGLGDAPQLLRVTNGRHVRPYGLN
jgi:hypothetical protein